MKLLFFLIIIGTHFYERKKENHTGGAPRVGGKKYFGRLDILVNSLLYKGRHKAYRHLFYFFLLSERNGERH